MKNYFLLEVGVEELPSRFVESTLAQIKENLEKSLTENRVEFDDIETYATPRRLTFIINKISDNQADLEEEVKGPSKKIAVDADGNFRIYYVKTSRYSFYDFTDKYGNRVNYFINPSATQRMSAKNYYTLQLSAYKNLFESQYHTPITTLAVLPFVLNYNNNNS